MKTLQEKRQANGRTLALNGTAWRKLRAAVLRLTPLCRHCPSPATDVDHVDNDPSNNDRDNLQGLCHECHSRKTNADMGRRVAYGCNDKGIPLDKSHPWHVEKSPVTGGLVPIGNHCFDANRESPK